jgi:hypothetical protein
MIGRNHFAKPTHFIQIVEIEMSNSSVHNVAVAIDEYEYGGCPRDEHHDIVMDWFLQLQELIAIVESMIHAAARSNKDNACQWKAFSNSCHCEVYFTTDCTASTLKSITEKQTWITRTVLLY